MRAQVKPQVDFGDFRHTILAGMKKEREDPWEVEGRQALFVVNLAPRTMAGLVSEGMLFDIGHEDGITPVLAVPRSPSRTAPAPADGLQPPFGRTTTSTSQSSTWSRRSIWSTDFR